MLTVEDLENCSRAKARAIGWKLRGIMLELHGHMRQHAALVTLALATISRACCTTGALAYFHKRRLDPLKGGHHHILGRYLRIKSRGKGCRPQ